MSAPRSPSEGAGDGALSMARRAVDEEAERLGLVHRAWLDAADLAPLLAAHPSESHRRYGLESAGALMVAALAYDEGPPPDPAQAPPLATIARFARANWYAELTGRLRAAALHARTILAEAGLPSGPSSAWRQVANSGLPERPLALAAGLGYLGRSGLLLVPGGGPGLVLGLLVLPSLPGELGGGKESRPGSEAWLPGALCGSCRACVEACPSGALSLEGRFERERCIQHWTSRSGDLPPPVEEAWEDQLYGCDRCVASCPRFAPVSTVRPSLGLLGPGLGAAWVSAAGDEELRSRLRGSALDRRWIEPAALRRNARLALRPKLPPRLTEGGPNPRVEQEG